MTAPADSPVVLVHGWAGSFRETWQSTGMDALLEDGGRSVIGVDLLGHGDEEKPHDPEAYARLDEWLLRRLAGAPPVVDAVGFSLGAMTVLGALTAEPGRFGRVVLAGIGDGMLEERGPDDGKKIIAALEGTGDSSDPSAQIFANYANAPGKDKAALTAVMKRPRQAPVDPMVLASIENPVLVVIGDKDFTHPADRLASSFPNGKLVVLRNTDHFATPESFAFIDAVLEFLGAA
ncbi:MAG: alpha/beta fold hydrolase [Actinomycetota bacterium]